jgi:hypothetical protein
MKRLSTSEREYYWKNSLTLAVWELVREQILEEFITEKGKFCLGQGLNLDL